MWIKRILLLVLVTCSFIQVTNAQLPVEVVGGTKKITLDVMFFKFIKNKQGNSSNFLFFNRNRASIDYRMTSSTYLPQFGCTEAISYNSKKMRGFAPVIVGQIINQGVYAKAGLQYAFIRKDFLVFSWFVSELNQFPSLDYFILARYTPRLSAHFQLYSQLESLMSIPTLKSANYSYVQRFRLGVKSNQFQVGLALDLTQFGRNSFIHTNNTGIFIRYDFN